MSPIIWRLQHPIQWRDGQRYRRHFGARSVTRPDIEAAWEHARTSAGGDPRVRFAALDDRVEWRP